MVSPRATAKVVTKKNIEKESLKKGKCDTRKHSLHAKERIKRKRGTKVVKQTWSKQKVKWQM